MKIRSFFRTIMGGNPDQREWLRTQVDESGRLPPFQQFPGKAIWIAFLVGIPIGLVMWVTGVPVSVRGPFAIAWALCGWAFAMRQYRWLKASSEFQALA